MRKLVAAVLFALIASGCALPRLRVKGGDMPQARARLAAFALNQCVATWWEDDELGFAYAAELAEALRDHWPVHAPDVATMRHRFGQRGSFAPQSMIFRGPVPLPHRRSYEGRWVRAALYPVLGLPVDILEVPLKGVIFPVFGLPMTGEDKGLITNLIYFPFAVALFFCAIPPTLLSSPYWVERDAAGTRLKAWAVATTAIYRIWRDPPPGEPTYGSIFFMNARRIEREDEAVEWLRDRVTAWNAAQPPPRKPAPKAVPKTAPKRK